MTNDSIPTPLSSEEIEREKDKMDLRPAIQFIEENVECFNIGREALIQRTPSAEAEAWGSHLKFTDTEKIRGPQIQPELARMVLARMPEALIKLSKLETVSYQYAGEVIEPVYNPDGTLKTGNTVPLEDWGKNNEHPTRVLIGLTPYDGRTIHQSALPEAVYKQSEAAEVYQLHVLIHEFFHTVEQPVMQEGRKASVEFKADGKIFTFQQWWDKFEEVFMNENEGFVSRYASGYENSLTPAMKRKDPVRFDRALAEQICESFVAYQLNIISNDAGWTDFKKAMPQTWRLIDVLCRAGLVFEDARIKKYE